jgi:hypothetical protein
LEYSVEYYPNKVTPTNSFYYISDVVMNMVIIIRMTIRFGDYDDKKNNNNNSNNRVKTKVMPVIIGATGTISESLRK